MRLIRIFFIFLFLSQGSMLKAQTDPIGFFSAFNNNKEIKKVLITRAMLENINLNKLNIPIEVGDMMDQLDQIEVYISTTKKSAKEIRSTVKENLLTSKYEKLLIIKDSSEDVSFYGIKMDKKTYKEIIMFVLAQEVVTLVRLVGRINIDELQHLYQEE